MSSRYCFVVDMMQFRNYAQQQETASALGEDCGLMLCYIGRDIKTRKFL